MRTIDRYKATARKLNFLDDIIAREEFVGSGLSVGIALGAIKRPCI